MPHIQDIVADIAATSSKTGKEAIIHDAMISGRYELFLGAKLAYDKLVTFGVKKVPLAKHIPHGSTKSWKEFVDELAVPLQRREITGLAASSAINEFMKACHPDHWNGWYRLVLMADLKCGASEKTFNKVIENGMKKDPSLKKYLIPVFTCQLAHPGEKFPNKMVGKKYIDVKLDGVRIIAVLNKKDNKVTLHSRNGLINTNFPQLENLLETVLDDIPESIVVDGEVISESFQELMSQFSRKENSNTDDAKFAVFDALPLSDFTEGVCSAAQSERNELAEAVCNIINDPRIYYIPKTVVDLNTTKGQETFKKFNRDAVEAGFEGIMVKDIDAPYQCKRSHAWLKLKPVITVDLKIVGLEAGEVGTKYEHCLGVINCEGFDEESGKFITVGVGSGLTDKQREEFWNLGSKLHGHMVEIKADAITTNKDGTYSLRFPRFVRFRPDKD